jgi:hypothetical protein
VADDVTVDNGGGTDYDVATDDDGSGNHVQIVKLAQSADGSRTPITADGGGMLVNLGANNDVTVTGSVTATQAGDVVVVGTDANGATATGDPVLIAGSDGTDVHTLNVDGQGKISINSPSLAAGTANIGDVDVLTVPAPLSTTGGGTEATAHRVTIANDSTGVLSVDDNGGALTVDATDLDIRNLDVAQDDVRVGGMAAHDAAVADNPVTIGGRSNDAVPSEVSADGEAVWAWMLRNGAQVVAAPPHLGLIADPYTLLHETVQTTTTQTGTDILTVTSGKKLVVTYCQIQVGGTTAGSVQIWFGATADTTYSRGTDRAIFDGEFAPSATLKPGFVCAPPTPWIGATDEELHLTTSAAINPLTVTVWYYEV